MSDFHGRHDLFLAMLDKIAFSGTDTLYVLGDVADRGDWGIETYLHLMEMPNAVFLVGNHELLFLDAYRKYRTSTERGFIRSGEWLLWCRNGGLPTWTAFTRLSPERQKAVITYIADAWLVIPDLVVGGRHFYLCHAAHLNTYTDRPVRYREVRGRTARHVVWDRIYPRHTYLSREYDSLNYKELYSRYPRNTVMIFGHTPTNFLNKVDSKMRGRIWHGGSGHLIDIDCGCASLTLKGACLGCLRLDDMKEFYVAGNKGKAFKSRI